MGFLAHGAEGDLQIKELTGVFDFRVPNNLSLGHFSTGQEEEGR